MKNRHGHIVEHKRQVPNVVVLMFALAGMVAAVASLAIIAPEILPLFQSDALANDNHTWLTREWAQSDRSPEEIATVIEIMEDNGITLAYLQMGSWHGQTGNYIELPYSQTFVERFRAQTSKIDLYVWVNIPPDKLTDIVSQGQVLAFAKQAVSENHFRGVHIQARSVPSESEEFITLLRNLRTNLGEDIILSITVPPDRTPLDPDIPASPVNVDNLTWSQDYKRRVLLNVDEVVLMSHASGLTTTDDYEQWVAYQVATYAKLIADLGIELNYVIALPTYDAELGHDPSIENTETAIQGVQLGIARAGEAGSTVAGVGLYPWEQTDLLELDTYWEDWVQRKN